MFQTKNWALYGLVIGLSLFHVYCKPRELSASSKCHNSDSPGKCIPITNCASALETIKKQRTHGLQRCGFEGIVEIVCCPDSEMGLGHNDDDQKKTSIRGGNLKRKSQQACEKYVKETPIDLAYYIVDGENAQLGEFPHMVALGFLGKDDKVYRFSCGGTLISPQYILTAAHCLINVHGNELKIARLGVINVPELVKNPDPRIDYNVVDITVHKQYKWQEKFNDIALVELEKKVAFGDNIRPACLYTKNDDPKKLVVTGWGAVGLGAERSSILQKASLHPVPLQECNSTYHTRTQKHIIRDQICATSNKSDTCQGDSGGPLQIQSMASISTVVGITSYGIGCGSNYPGVYTRVSGYLDWIEKIVWPGAI
ncbi:serine protease persephone-like [Zophobas morio]|uniref:serine protease persephone-like n=1 Tax=Zophobas morio TaxID=2755281 RepID=UPI003083DB5B